MSAKYTGLGQLEGKFGVPAREYLTARDFGGNLYLKTYSLRPLCAPNYRKPVLYWTTSTREKHV